MLRPPRPTRIKPPWLAQTHGRRREVVPVRNTRRNAVGRSRTAAIASEKSDASAVAVDVAASTSSSTSLETAESVLEDLGLTSASARRLVRRAAALRKRFAAPGGGGGGGSGGGKEAAAPPTPTAGDVSSAARALLDIGFGIREVGSLIERAPGLLNVPREDVERRAESFLFLSSSPESPSSPSSPTLARATLLRILRHRPAALCARSAERRLSSSLRALLSAGAGPSKRSLAVLARDDPGALYRADAGEVARAARELYEAVPSEAVPRLLCERSREFMAPARSSASASSGSSPSPSGPSSSVVSGAVERTKRWLASPPVSLSPQQAERAISEEPFLLSRSPSDLDAVAAALAAAGVEGSDLASLVAAWPRVLTREDAADVGVRARLATEVLGATASSLSRSPRLLFSRSVTTTVGPRFAFARAKRSEEGGDGESGGPFGLSPSTLLRGDDADFCASLVAGGRRRNGSEGQGRGDGALGSGPARLLLEEYHVFKRRWLAESARAAAAEGVAAREAERRKRESARKRRELKRRRRKGSRGREGGEEEGGEEKEERPATATATSAAKKQPQQQPQKKKERAPVPEGAAGATLEAIAALRTRKKTEKKKEEEGTPKEG